MKEQERGSKEGGRRSRTTGNDVYVRRALEAKALAQKQQQEEAEEAGRVKSEETTHRAKKARHNACPIPVHARRVAVVCVNS